MKKIMVVLALASFSLTSMAQEEETPTLKHSVATNSFWNNWFVQANGTYTAFYSNEEKPADYSKSPFKHFRRSFGLSVALGKWFTPGIGMRTKLSGFWGKSVLGKYGQDARIKRLGIKTPNVNGFVGEEYCNAIKYFNLQEQVLLNVSNMVAGYNPDRVWNLIPYAGVGAVRNCTYNTWELAGSLGLLNTWKLTDRLSSRFAWGLIADIGKPDFETRVAILQKKCADDMLDIDREVLELIASRVDSNIRELEGCLKRLSAYSFLTGRRIDRQLAEDALREVFQSSTPRQLTCDEIIEAVAQYYSLTGDDLKGPRRNREISIPRQIAMYLCREVGSASFPHIGDAFGRDHSTIQHGCDRIAEERRQNPSVETVINDLTKQLLER